MVKGSGERWQNNYAGGEWRYLLLNALPALEFSDRIPRVPDKGVEACGDIDSLWDGDTTWMLLCPTCLRRLGLLW